MYSHQDVLPFFFTTLSVLIFPERLRSLWPKKGVKAMKPLQPAAVVQYLGVSWTAATAHASLH